MVTMLRPRLGTLDSRRVASVSADSWRAGKEGSTARGYGYRWQKARARHLRSSPLCVMCLDREDRPTPATVVDHKTPHRGDQTLFWDETNWQSLCKSCHDGEKQRQEKAEFALK